MNEYPDILISKETGPQKIQKIMSVKGIDEKFRDSVHSYDKKI